MTGSHPNWLSWSSGGQSAWRRHNSLHTISRQLQQQLRKHAGSVCALAVYKPLLMTGRRGLLPCLSFFSHSCQHLLQRKTLSWLALCTEACNTSFWLLLCTLWHPHWPSLTFLIPPPHSRCHVVLLFTCLCKQDISPQNDCETHLISANHFEFLWSKV